jgi:hypothetical protein
VLGVLKPDLMPPIPLAERDAVSRRQLWLRFWKVVVPPILLVVSVLGSIVGGVAAPTEAAAMGAVGAVLITVGAGRFSWAILKQVALETSKITAIMMFILLMAQVFALAFRGLHGEDLIVRMFEWLPGGVNSDIWFMMALTFVLGFFIEWIPAHRAVAAQGHRLVNLARDMTDTRPPLPPFTDESAIRKVRGAEDAWNTRDPAVCARVRTDDTRWRKRAEFPVGRDEVKALLRRKWAREPDDRQRRAGTQGRGFHAAAVCEHQRPAHHRGRAPPPLAAGPAARRSPGLERARALSATPHNGRP